DAEAVGVVLPGAVVGICGHGEFHLWPPSPCVALGPCVSGEPRSSDELSTRDSTRVITLMGFFPSYKPGARGRAPFPWPAGASPLSAVARCALQHLVQLGHEVLAAPGSDHAEDRLALAEEHQRGHAHHAVAPRHVGGGGHGG